ncbi:hypothetical protein J1N35_022711 [Gossypium stocksii]|uniref:Uncharacterized protein n=1 Tax=Gossypium stocksii TaxID=47602 RepID=A0A9D3VGZ5_9ROSI|nr:hypothetical protein J1N35_022711 [Gossypium stocksii]
MATEVVPVVDMPRHSSNTGEAVHSQGHGYDLEGFVLGTVLVPSPLITRNEVKSLSDNLIATDSLVTEQEQVSITLTGLSIEYESICVIASATPMSLDLLTEMLLDCDARQMALLIETPTTILMRLSKDIKGKDTKGKDESGLVVMVRVGHTLDRSANYVAKLAMWFNLVITGLMKISSALVPTI